MNNRVLGSESSQHNTSDTQTRFIPRRSGRVIIRPDQYMFLGESYDYVLDEQGTDPCNYDEALQDKDADLW